MAKFIDPRECSLEEWYATSKPLAAARRKLAAASARRRDLPAGSTRAKVTTANAKWATAAEAVDRIETTLRNFWETARGKVTP